MVGIANIVMGIGSLNPDNFSIEGLIVGLAIGMSATVASSMYNPCGCCPCDGPDSGTRGTSSSRLKIISMLCVVAAVAALAGVVTDDSCYSAVHGGEEAANDACSSPALEKGKYDCVAGGPYPPFETVEEPLTCFEDRVPCPRGVDAIALLVAVPAAYHTWMEAAQAQEKEFAGV